MDTVGQIASRVATRYCDQDHSGVTPCPTCALARAIASEAIHDFIECVVAHATYRGKRYTSPE